MNTSGVCGDSDLGDRILGEDRLDPLERFLGCRLRHRAQSRRVLANGLAVLGEITVAAFDRRGFEFRGHRVIEAVEKAEQGDDRNDVDDLRVAVMPTRSAVCAMR